MDVRFLVLCLVGVLLTSSALSSKRALVLLQDVNTKSEYGSFFSSLSAIGFDLDFKGSKDSSIKLKDYDNWLYDHLILFTPKAEVFGGVDSAGILEFIDSGHDAIIVVGSEVSETMRTLTGECGVDLDDKSTRIYDHFNFLVQDSASDHSLVVTQEILNSSVIFGSGIQAPVLYKGIAHSVQPENELAIIALSAPATAYSHDPRKVILEPPTLLVGQRASLVTLVQARNNARVLIAGSLDMFTDKFFDMPLKTPDGKEYATSGNKEFCVEAARWTFQDKAVLKAANLRHHLLGVDVQPTLYRVSDDVEFLIDIFLFESGKQLPYRADDVQVEFVMLDPYVRLPLVHDDKGTFKVAFKVPDVYGVFKYVINYRHLGYSYIQQTQQVPVRPFKHNEYDRFLTSAYPYYTSALTTMVAFFLLGFFYLYHK